jgi:hypothetical protein
MVVGDCLNPYWDLFMLILIVPMGIMGISSDKEHNLYGRDRD